MNSQSIGTIRLSGMDASNFLSSLYRPTDIQTEKRMANINRINDEIQIQDMNNGFIAEIAGLDLSFLDSLTAEKQINIEITMKLDIQEPHFFDDDKTFTLKKCAETYSKSENSSFLLIAA